MSNTLGGAAGFDPPANDDGEMSQDKDDSFGGAVTQSGEDTSAELDREPTDDKGDVAP